jgi:carbonic anhydrase
VVLGCIDSRAPAEIIFDAGIGDTFNARIAGNVVNHGLLGSLEFACAVAGAKVLLLLGDIACGAIKGAIDDVEMHNLTG